ncbi:MAG: hypothetical protein V7776_21960 [Halopseudomonas aestusnigri]
MKLKSKSSKRGIALSRLAKLGRFGDTELAHVNKEEVALLEARGGSGSINPRTGLREYYDAPGDNEAGANSPQDNTGLDGRGQDRSQENDNRDRPSGVGNRDDSQNPSKAGPADSVSVDKEAASKAATKAAADRHRGALEKEYSEIDSEANNLSAVTNGKVVGVPGVAKGWQHSTQPSQEFVDANPTLGGMHAPEMQTAWNGAVRGANGIGTASFSGLTKEQLSDIQAATSPVEQKALADTYAAQNNPVASFFSKVGSRVLAGVHSSPTYSLDSETFGQPAWNKSFNPGEFSFSQVASSKSGISGAIGYAGNLASLAGYPVGKAYENVTLDSTQRAQSRQAAINRNAQRDGEGFQAKSIYDSAAQSLYPNTEDNVNQISSPYTSFGKSKVRKAPDLSALKAKRANFGRVR